MGIKLLAIVPPGCVTTASNKGRRGGDGREMWVLGGGWVAGNKWEWIWTGCREENNGQQRTGGERGRCREGTRSGVLPSQTKNVTLSSFFSSLPLFFWFSLSISLSLCPCCSALIYRQHFPSPFYQCHKSNLPPLQWITVFQQTQQRNASVPPPQHSNSPSITDSDIASSQRHSDTSPLDNSVIILQTWLALGQGRSIHYKRKIHKKIETWGRKRAHSREFKRGQGKWRGGIWNLLWSCLFHSLRNY